MPKIDNFLGKWKMLPEMSVYAAGEPPKSGTYEIVQDGKKLTFIMDWVDAAGEAKHMAYSEICDGQFHPYTDAPIADEICLTLESDHILKSVAKLAGKVKLTAIRETTPQGQLKVTMSAKTPDGTPFGNHSTYQKLN